MSERFEFTDLVRSQVVVVDGDSLRYRKFPGWRSLSLNALDALYVDDRGRQATLILKLESGDRHAIVGKADDDRFLALTRLLAERSPEADIRELDRDAAIARVGLDRPELAWFPYTAAIFLGFALLFAWPHLMHGFDEGEAAVTLSELAAGETPESDNLLLDLEGRRPPSGGVVTVIEGERQARVVALSLGEGGRSVLLRTPPLSAEAYASLRQEAVLPVMLRDNLFEGLSDREAERLAGLYGPAALEDAVVVEYGATPEDARFIGLASTGTVLAIILIMFAALALRERHRQRRLA